MSTTTPGPSPQLMNVMLSLVKSIQAWSFYNDYLLRSALAKSLLIQLAAAIVKPTITQQYESTAQYICDVYFVKRICEGWDDLQASVKLLEESIQRSQTVRESGLMPYMPTHDFINGYIGIINVTRN